MDRIFQMLFFQSFQSGVTPNIPFYPPTPPHGRIPGGDQRSAPASTVVSQTKDTSRELSTSPANRYTSDFDLDEPTHDL